MTPAPRLTTSLRSARLVALGLWAGALLLTGAAAAIAFPTMKALDPSLPAFAAHPEHHWSIAAGHIMRRVFFVSDIVQLAAAAVVLTSLGVELRILRLRRTSMAWRVRALVMLGAVALALWQALVMSPGLNALLDAYWTSAQAGALEAAAQAKAAFDARHTGASRLLTATFALLCAAAIASILGASCDAGACRPEERA